MDYLKQNLENIKQERDNKAMSQKTLQEQFTEFKDQIKVLREKITHTGQQFLISQLKATFEKYPQLKEVSWRQYTPWFNDGETCEFHSGHSSPDFEAEGVEYGSQQYIDIRQDLKQFLCQFDDDLVYDLFGDHASVTVTREGITIEEFEHD